MPERTVSVTLEITYDTSYYDHPKDWTWSVLLDAANDDQVRVTGWTE